MKKFRINLTPKTNIIANLEELKTKKELKLGRMVADFNKKTNKQQRTMPKIIEWLFSIIILITYNKIMKRDNQLNKIEDCIDFISKH